MKVLVTGGAGFIASHIVDLLVEKGYEVCVVDNLSKGRKNNVNASAVLHVADITDLKSLDAVFAGENPLFVIHHAAQINIRTSIENPQEDAKQNIIGTLNVLECCKKYGVKRIVFASSGGAVYGDSAKLPCGEDSPENPLSPYGVSKLSAEQYIKLFGAFCSIEYVILRYSNVYGPRQNAKGEAGVISIFSEKMLKRDVVCIFGDGCQTRDFVYVADVARANLLALKCKSGVTINIGTGKQTSINQLCEEMSILVKTPVKVKNAPAIAGEIRRSYLDVSLAKNVLGWEPLIGLKEGLEKTIKWFESNAE